MPGNRDSLYTNYCKVKHFFSFSYTGKYVSVKAKLNFMVSNV